jgi:hypothetical protein
MQKSYSYRSRLTQGTFLDRIQSWEEGLIEESSIATNLVSLVMQFLTPDMIGRIAIALGLDRNKAQLAISSAVPAILAAFNDTATQPGGAQKLADTARQQAGSLRKFASVLAEGGQSSLFEEGSQMLASLVSGQNQNALTEAIAKFTGLPQGASGSLLSILVPIVMDTIAHHQGKRGLDANGIANLFVSQKDSIAAALPSSFGSLLSGTSLLSSLSGAAPIATAAGGEAARTAAHSVSNAGHQVTNPTASGLFNWRYWLILAAAIAAVLIFLLAR